MMRVIFVSEQKRWEAAQAKTAATIPTIYEDEELELENTDEPHFSVSEQTYMGSESTCHATMHSWGLLSDKIPRVSDSSSSDIDEMLDRDGQELEALLSQLDLDFDQVMSDASHQMLSMQCT